jgi:hypothetical protein
MVAEVAQDLLVQATVVGTLRVAAVITAAEVEAATTVGEAAAIPVVGVEVTPAAEATADTTRLH